MLLHLTGTLEVTPATLRELFYVVLSCEASGACAVVAHMVRCFARLPSDKRLKIVLLPDDGSFETFKQTCAVKLGLQPETSIKLLLGSNVAPDVKVDVDVLPEIEALDELSPEDTIIVLPEATAAGVPSSSSDAINNSGKEDPHEEEEEEEEEEEDDECDAEDAEEDEEEEDAEDEVEDKDVQFVSERTRKSLVDGGLSKAKREGRFVELKHEEGDSEESDEDSDEDDEEWMAPNKARGGGGGGASRVHAGRSSSGGGGSGGSGGSGGGDAAGSAGRKRPRATKPAAPPKPAPKPTIEAVLDDDTEPATSGGGSGGAGGAGAGSSSGGGDGGGGGGGELEKIKARIRKMLSRGLHAGTPEEEAASSMRLAEKLLAKHNLAQADVLQDDHVPEALRGGKTAVHLRSVKDQTPCQTKQWMHTLAHACTKNFECAYYFSSHPTRTVGRLHYKGVCDFTFYGIATNASLAAFAFAAAFNRIACLAAAHTVPGEEFEAKRSRGEIRCSKGAYTSAARESYKDGLARGLYDMVRRDKATKELEAQRRLELARSKASRGEAWQSSDDEDDDDEGGGGGGGGVVGGGGGGAGDSSDEGDADTKGRVTVEDVVDDDDACGSKDAMQGARQSGGGADSSSCADGGDEQKPVIGGGKTAADAVAKLEREAASKSALVAHTESVAASFLKEVGVKLSNRKHTYTKSTWRKESYEKGQADAKEIDINQRSLKGGGGGGGSDHTGKGKGKAKVES